MLLPWFIVIGGYSIWEATETILGCCHSLLMLKATTFEKVTETILGCYCCCCHSLLVLKATTFEKSQRDYSWLLLLLLPHFIIAEGYNIWEVTEKLFSNAIAAAATVCCWRLHHLRSHRENVLGCYCCCCHSLLLKATTFEKLQRDYSRLLLLLLPQFVALILLLDTYWSKPTTELPD